MLNVEELLKYNNIIQGRLGFHTILCGWPIRFIDFSEEKSILTNVQPTKVYDILLIKQGFLQKSR